MKRPEGLTRLWLMHGGADDGEEAVGLIIEKALMPTEAFAVIALVLGLPAGLPQSHEVVAGVCFGQLGSPRDVKVGGEARVYRPVVSSPRSPKIVFCESTTAAMEWLQREREDLARAGWSESALDPLGDPD